MKVQNFKDPTTSITLSQKAGIEILSSELHAKIYSFLDAKDRGSLRTTCKYWSVLGGQSQKELKLKKLDEKLICSFPNLESLHVNHSIFKRNAPSDFKILVGLKKLNHIVLQNAHISPGMISSLNSLRGLELLFPKGIDKKNLSTESLMQLTNLEGLVEDRLEENLNHRDRGGSERLKSLKSMGKLRLLKYNVFICRVSDLPISVFEKLDTLIFNHIFYQGDDLIPFSRMPKLKRLYICSLERYFKGKDISIILSIQTLKVAFIEKSSCSTFIWDPENFSDTSILTEYKTFSSTIKYAEKGSNAIFSYFRKGKQIENDELTDFIDKCGNFTLYSVVDIEFLKHEKTALKVLRAAPFRYAEILNRHHVDLNTYKNLIVDFPRALLWATHNMQLNHMEEFLSINLDAFEYLKPKLQLSYIVKDKKNCKFIQKLSSNTLQNSARHLIKFDPMNLAWLPQEFKDNWQLVNLAVSIYGGTLEFASDRLKKDEQICLNAIVQLPSAMRFCDPSLVKTEDFLIKLKTLVGPDQDKISTIKLVLAIAHLEIAF